MYQKPLFQTPANGSLGVKTTAGVSIGARAFFGTSERAGASPSLGGWRRGIRGSASISIGGFLSGRDAHEELIRAPLLWRLCARNCVEWMAISGR